MLPVQPPIKSPEDTLSVSLSYTVVKPLVSPDSSGKYTDFPAVGYASRNFYTATLIPDGHGVAASQIHLHHHTEQPFVLNNFIFIFSIVLLFVFASLRLFYGKAIWGLGKAVINFAWAVKAYEERNTLLVRVYLILDLIYLVNASLAVFFAARYFFRPDISVFQLLGFSGLAVTFIYLIRTTLVWFVAAISQQGRVAEEFLMVTNVFYKAAGILLFFPVILFAYISDDWQMWLAYFSLIILATAYILNIIRGMYFAMKSKFYIYYYFLYLCAVEIMPVLLTIKMFMLTNSI